MNEDAVESGNLSHKEAAKDRDRVVLGVGVVEEIGRRPEMEDTHRVVEPFRGKPDESFFGVYDGYGGKVGSQIARDFLHSHFQDMLDKGVDAREALEEAFARVDERIEDEDPNVGTAAAVLYLRGREGLVGNVGDVRVVLERGGRAVRLSRDHKPDDPEERSRIEKAGGRVEEGSNTGEGWPRFPARVEGVLAMSRALGSRELGGLVPPDPHLEEFRLRRGDKRAILACDGMWNVIEDQEAVEMIKRFKYPNIASEFLMREAIKRKSADNITVMVVDFKQSAL